MATKSIAWNDGSGDYIRLTYSGSGNDTITVESDANNTANARSKVIVLETTAGSPVVTKNLTVNQAACPFPVGDIRNYGYTGSYQEVELPAGKYKLQCWGAQGGSNGTNSSYGITAKAGGKGGYSEGVLTLSQKTTVRIYVGGQGSSAAGGFNGGGSTTGTSQYNSGNTFGYSKMGGGGGATDIRLSDGALLSRMIVAGGGSGGAMCYQEVTTQVTEEVEYDYYGTNFNSNGDDYQVIYTGANNLQAGTNYYIVNPSGVGNVIIKVSASSNPFADTAQSEEAYNSLTPTTSGSTNPYVHLIGVGIPAGQYMIRLCYKVTETHTETTTSSDYQVGYAGGGTNGAGYSSTYQGKQNAAGTNGSFGQGANQTTSGYRYASGAGGGGWYGGGGGQYSDSTMSYCQRSGGGSGWVNIAANAGNRPSGYTGLQLDSGTTYAGNTSFPSTGGGTETGHSGNGYARITRLE